MITDACNVEDINIPKITEWLSLSLVASCEDWFCLFRTWSFTLCKNDLDSNDNSDSVLSSSITNWWARFEQTTGLTVLAWFPSSKMTFLQSWGQTIGLRRSIVHQFIRFPLLRRPSFINVPFRAAWWVCAYNGSPRSILLLNLRTQRVLTLVSGFPRDFWCSRRQRWWSSFTASRDQTQHWFRLGCDPFFTWIFLCSFRHHFRTLCGTEMANVYQTQKMIPFITCEISLGQYVCELVFGVNVFDLDFGVQTDSINNQSRATLWVLATCLIVGLLPFNDHFDHCFIVFKHIQ